MTLCHQKSKMTVCHRESEMTMCHGKFEMTVCHRKFEMTMCSRSQILLYLELYNLEILQPKLHYFHSQFLRIYEKYDTT